jgi:hypothetical protein
MGMFLSRNPGDYRMYTDTVPGTATTYLAAVPAESALVSVEHLASGRGAGRVRFASGPPPMPAQRIQMSDILLLQSGVGLPNSLEVAAAAARPNTRVPTDTALRVFWELYGLVEGDSVKWTLTATENGRSALTDIGRFLGVLGRERSSLIEWAEVVSTSAPVVPRSIGLDISTFSSGTYTLRLQASVPGHEVVAVTKEITAVR